MNFLEQLRSQSKVVADTGDIESIHKYKPVDATTNPTLILQAVETDTHPDFMEDCIRYAKSSSNNKDQQVKLAMDKLIVNYGSAILHIVSGRVSTETDARLSFDTEGIINKAQELIHLYEAEGIDRSRVLIKIASTWEGIKAAGRLEKEGIRCNLTLLFSLIQAIACADAGVQLVSPFVGRILDWYKKNVNPDGIVPKDEPGVNLVKGIYTYYKKFGYKTEIMGASFRNTGEIIELSGCDLLTISPPLLKELEQTEGELKRKLIAEDAKTSEFEKLIPDEKTFRWNLNEDAMATEKLSEGIRKFTADTLKLEQIISKKL